MAAQCSVCHFLSVNDNIIFRTIRKLLRSGSIGQFFAFEWGHLCLTQYFFVVSENITVKLLKTRILLATFS